MAAQSWSRYSSLAVLCLPLVWIGYLEVGRLVESLNPRAPYPDRGHHPDDLEGLAREAQEVLDSAAPVKRSVVCLADPEPGSTASHHYMIKSLADHGNARKAAREKVAAERSKAVEAWERITVLKRKLLAPDPWSDDQSKAIDEFDQQLEEYRAGPVHEEELYRPNRVWADWIRLDHTFPERLLADLYRELDQWTPAAPLVNPGEPGEPLRPPGLPRLSQET